MVIHMVPKSAQILCLFYLETNKSLDSFLSKVLLGTFGISNICSKQGCSFLFEQVWSISYLGLDLPGPKQKSRMDTFHCHVCYSSCF